MIRMLFWRFLQGILVLWIVYTLTFWMLMLIPGDPFVGEKKPPKSVLDALHARYGIEVVPDKILKQEQRNHTPWYRTQRFHNRCSLYATYGKKALQVDFGPTIQYESYTVKDVIIAALPVSAALGCLALLIALWLGVAAGTLGALARGRPLDLALTVVSLFGVSLPNFVIGTLLLLTFGVAWPILPAGGWGTLRQLILPACTLALLFMAYIARLTRVSVLDVLSADYVRTARAKGQSETKVIANHVLRNATLPILSYLGPSAAMVLTGSFVVEKIFAIPGLGADFVNACLNADTPLVLGTVLIYTVIVVILNLLVDVAYAAVDPRIRMA